MTNIEEADKLFLDTIDCGGIAMVSCFVNGEPSVAICMVDKREDGGADVYPRYVRITPGMKLEDHDGVEPKDLTEKS